MFRNQKKGNATNRSDQNRQNNEQTHEGRRRIRTNTVGTKYKIPLQVRVRVRTRTYNAYETSQRKWSIKYSRLVYWYCIRNWQYVACTLLKPKRQCSVKFIYKITHTTAPIRFNRIRIEGNSTNRRKAWNWHHWGIRIPRGGGGVAGVNESKTIIPSRRTTRQHSNSHRLLRQYRHHRQRRGTYHCALKAKLPCWCWNLSQKTSNNNNKQTVAMKPKPKTDDTFWYT